MGKVDTGGHTPLANNDVVLVLPDGSRLHQPTDDTGAFSFHNLNGGFYFLVVDLRGFTGVNLPQLKVSAGQTTDVGTIVPVWALLDSTAKHARVRGLVRGELHPDGGGSTSLPDGGAAPDAGDPDMGGAQVKFFLPGENGQPDTLVAVAVADSAGNFVQDMPTGDYNLTASHPLFVTTQPKIFSVYPDAGTDTFVPEALVMPLNPATVTGPLLEEVDLDIADAGLAGDGGLFVPAVGVTVGTQNGGSGTSNQQGGFTVTNLLGKPDSVFFSVPQNVANEHFHDSVANHPVLLTPGEVTSLDPIRFYLDRGSITGKVKMADGSAARDVTVSVVGTHFATTVSPDATDPSVGTFIFQGVPARFGYQVKAEHTRYSSAVTQQAVNLAGDGSTVDVGTLTLALLQGDFSITSTAEAQPGFTHTLDVMVKLQSAPNAVQIRIGETADLGLADGGNYAWQPFTASGNAATLSDFDGLHLVYAQYEDAQGVASPVFNSTIVVDRQRPGNASVAVTSGKAFVSQTQNLSITLLATDSPATATAVASGLWEMTIASDFDGGDPDAGVLAGTPIGYAAYSGFPPAGAPPMVDGTQTIYAQFKDNAGNYSPVVQAQVVVDTIAPAGQIQLGSMSGAAASGYTNSPLVNVYELFSLEDGGYDSTYHEPNGGWVKVRLANGSQAGLNTATELPALSPQSWFLDSAVDGSKTVWMRLVDAAGNTSPDYSTTIVLDRAAPVASVLLTEDGGAVSATNQGSVQLQLVTSEQPTPEVAIFTTAQDCAAVPEGDGGYGPFPATAPPVVSETLSGPDGLKTFYVCFRDQAGNVTSSQAQVRYDVTAPTGTASLSDGHYYQQTGALTLHLAASDDTAGMAVVVDPAGSVDCTSTSYLPFAADSALNVTDGAHVVAVCLRDQAGNVSTAPLSASAFADTVDPTGSIVLSGTLGDLSPSTTTTASTQITVTSTATDPGAAAASGLALMQISNFADFHDGAWEPYMPNAPWTLTSGDGLKTIYARFQDAAGRTSTTASATITLDTAAPAAPVLTLQGRGPTGGFAGCTTQTGYSSQSVVTATATSPDAVAVDLSPTADGGTLTLDLTAGNSTALPLPAGDGVKTVTARFKDAARNTTTVFSAITVDSQAPAAPQLQIVEAPYSASGTVDVKLSASGANRMVLDGTGSIRSGDAVVAFVPSTTVTLSPTGEGPRQVAVRYFDESCNYADADAGVTVDSTPPTGTLSIVGRLADNSIADGGATASPVVALALTASDGTGSGVAQMIISARSDFSDATYQSFAPTVSSFQLSAGDGVKTIYAKFRDQAGNESTPVSASISLDTQPPTTPTITLTEQDCVPGNGITNNTALLVSAQAGGAASIDLSLDPAFAAYVDGGPDYVTYAGPSITNQPFTLTSGDGTKVVWARFRDAARNSSTASAQVVLDTTGPSAPSVSIVESPFTRSATVDLNLSASGDPQQMVVTTMDVDGGNATTVTSPYSAHATAVLPNAFDGSKVVRVRFLDSACNSSDGGDPNSVATTTLDSAAPTGSVAITGYSPQGQPLTSATATTSVTLTLSTIEPTNAQMEVSNASDFSGASWQPFQSTLSWSLPTGDGSKTVYARFMDQAGNISNSVSASISLDTAAPSAPVLTFSSASSQQGCAPLAGYTRLTAISVNASANGSTAVDLSEDPSFPSATTVTKPTPVSNQAFTLSSGDGSKTLYARFRDAAGNSTTTTVVATLDTAVPATPTVSITESPVTSTPNIDLVLGPASAATFMIVAADGVIDTETPVAFNTALNVTVPSSSQGSKTVKVRYFDAACNVSAADGSATTTLDTVAPTGTIAITGYGPQGQTLSGSTATTSVTLSLSTSETTSAQMEVSNASDFSGASWQPFQSTLSWSLPTGDGSKTVYARFMDQAGNVSNAVNAAITLDTAAPTAPTLTFTSSSAQQGCTPVSGYTRTTAISVSANATGATAVDLSEDPSFPSGTTVTKPTPVSNQAFTLSSGDGSKTLYARFRDGASNSTTTSVVATLDTAVPSTPTVTITESPVTKSASVDLVLGPANAATYMIVAADGVIDTETPVAFNTALVVSVPSASDGSKTVRVRYFDSACNVSADGTASTTLDTAAPTGSVVITGYSPQGQSLSNGFTGSPNVTLTLSTSETTSAQMEVSNASDFSGASWQPFQSTLSWSLPTGDGSKTVYARFMDQAGNVSNAVNASVTLDTAAPSSPSFTFTSASAQQGCTPQSGYTRLTAISVSGNATGATAVDLNEDPSFPSASTITKTLPLSSQAFTLSTGDGAKTLYGRFRDGAGNSVVASLSITLDTVGQSAPTVTFTQGSYTKVPGVTALISSSDTGLWMMAVAGDGTIDTEQAVNYASSVAVSLPSSPDGAKPVQVRLYDQACNAGSSTSATITLDTAAPTGTISLSGLTDPADVRTSASSVSVNLSPNAGTGAPITGFRLSLDPSFSSTAFSTYPPTVNPVSFQLGAQPGLQTIYAQFQDQAGNNSTGSISASLTLDNQPPVFTTGVAIARDLRPGSTVVTYAGADNLDPPTKLAIGLQLDAQPTCATGTTLTSIDGGAVLFTVPSLADGDHVLYGCLRDQAGNVSVTSQAPVRLDTVIPAGPSVNQAVPLASGALVSWTDNSNDSAYFEVDYSLNPTFPGGGSAWDGGTSVSLAAGGGSCEPRVAPATSLSVGLVPDAGTLTNFRNWYFRVRAVDCAGNKSDAGPNAQATTVPNLATVVRQDVPSGEAKLFSDGTDLWMTYPASPLPSNAPPSEELLHCQAGAKDCRRMESWKNVSINLGALEPSIVANSPFGTAFFADDNTLFMAKTQLHYPDGGLLSAQESLEAAYCDRNGDCDDTSNWSQGGSPDNDLVIRTASAGSGIYFGTPVAAVSGRMVILAYPRSTDSGFTWKLSVSRCLRSHDNMQGAMCRKASEWTSSDFGLPIDNTYPLTIMPSDGRVYVGFRSASSFGNITAAGQPGMAVCENSCDYAAACDSYTCGDLRYSTMDTTASIDSQPTTFAYVGGNFFAAYSYRVGSTEKVAVRYCNASNLCNNTSYFGAPFNLFSNGFDNSAPSGSGRANLSIDTTGSGVAMGVAVQLVYPAALGATVPPTLWLASCPLVGGGTACGSAGGWSNTMLAQGTGAAAPPSVATVDQNFYIAGQSAQGDTQLYTPIIPTMSDFFVGPQVGALQASWLAEQDSAGTNLLYQGVQPPGPVTELSISNAFVASEGLPLTTGMYSLFAQPFSAEGLADLGQPWVARPFLAYQPATDLNTTLGFSISAPGAANVPDAGPIPDPNVYYAYLQGAGSATGAISLGHCDAVNRDCSNAGNWSSALFNSNTSWNTVQVSADYPRDYRNGAPISPFARVFAGGRWSGNQYWLEGCDEAAGPCNGLAQSNVFLGDSHGTPNLRVVGDFVQVTDTAADGGVLVRYCDGAPAYPRDVVSFSGPELAGSTCFNAANWKTVVLSDPKQAVSPNMNPVGMPHPYMGWMVATPAQSGSGVGGGFLFWTCPRSKWNGGTQVIANDCSVPGNWTLIPVPASGGASGSSYTDLDIGFTNQGYNPIQGVNDETQGVFVSYRDPDPQGRGGNQPLGGWGVAMCRGAPDAIYLSNWACSQAIGNPDTTPGAIPKNWTSVQVAQAFNANALSSTVRIIGGDLLVDFQENTRNVLAICPEGANCHRAHGWHQVTTNSNFNVGPNTPAGMGFMTGDGQGDVFIGYPNVSGSTRSVNLLVNGMFHGP